MSLLWIESSVGDQRWEIHEATYVLVLRNVRRSTFRKTKLSGHLCKTLRPSQIHFAVLQNGYADLICSSVLFCLPSLSKFDISSHALNPLFTLGHSESNIENHAVSRLRPRAIICCLNVPSYLKPRRSAARREGAFRLLHFHSYRRKPRSSKT